MWMNDQGKKGEAKKKVKVEGGGGGERKERTQNGWRKGRKKIVEKKLEKGQRWVKGVHEENKKNRKERGKPVIVCYVIS